MTWANPFLSGFRFSPMSNQREHQEMNSLASASNGVVTKSTAFQAMGWSVSESPYGRRKVWGGRRGGHPMSTLVIFGGETAPEPKSARKKRNGEGIVGSLISKITSGAEGVKRLRYERSAWP